MHDSKTYDVVIAGAGPVGLFLACELRLGGATVLVLEQARDPHAPLKRLPFGMRGLSAPTIEAFYRRGMLVDITHVQPSSDKAASTTIAAPHWMNQRRRPGGHFAGIQLFLDDVEPSQWPYRLPIRGNAPETLLDSYHAERHRMGSEVLDWSRAQVALMRPSRSSRALETIIRDVMATNDGATYFAERIWGVSLHYELGGGHPLVGRSAPDFEFSNGTRLGEHLKVGKGVLLNFNADAKLREVASRWPDRIVHLALGAKNALGLSALLLRPDGVVAWASEKNLKPVKLHRQQRDG